MFHKLLGKINLSCLPLIFSFILLIVWFHNGNLLGGGESALPFYNLGQYTNLVSHSWTDSNLGMSNGLTVASYPFYSFFHAFNYLHVPPFLTEAVFFGLVLLAGMYSIWVLLKSLFPKISNYYALISSLFYVVNPWAMVNIWNRFLYNFIVFWAFLPLALLLFVLGIKRKKYLFAILFSLAATVFSYSFTGITFTVLLWFLFFFTSLFYFLTDASRRIFIIKYFLLNVILFVVTQFWWISQILPSLSSNYMSVSAVRFFTSSGNILALNALSARLGQLSNVLRLFHGSFSIDSGMSWTKYFSWEPYILLTLIVPLAIFWSIYKYHKNNSVLYLGLLSIITVFMMKGNLTPFGELFYYAFIKIPTLQIFRNPFEKFGFLLCLSFSLLFPFALSRIELLLDNKTKILRYLLLVLVLGIFGFPYLTGLVISRNDSSHPGHSVQYDVSVSSDYAQVNSWLKSQPGDFRFLSLPIGGEGITYTWPKSYSGVDLTNTLLDTPNISFNTTIPYYSDLVEQMTRYQINDSLFTFFPFTNIKYILFRNDVDYLSRPLPFPDNISQSLVRWQGKGWITFQKQFGKLTLYKINYPYISQKAYFTPNYIYTNYTDLPQLVPNFPGFTELPFAVISEPVPESALISPDKVFRPSVTGEDLSALSDTDIMSKLFYVNRLPGSWYDPIVRLKEQLSAPPASDYNGSIIYKIGLLGKHASEIYKLRFSHGSSSVIQQSEDAYLSELELDLDLIKNNALFDNDIGSLIRSSLMFQMELFKRIGSPPYERLENLAYDLKLRPRYSIANASSSAYLTYSFTIVKSGTYKIMSDQSQPYKIYLNGHAAEASNSYQLNKGFNEISIVSNDTEAFSHPIFSKASLNFTNNENQSWELSPGTLPRQYQMSFDYRFKEGRNFLLQSIFNGQHDPSLFPYTRVSKDENYHDWRHLNWEFTTPIGYTQIWIKSTPDIYHPCQRNWLGINICDTKPLPFSIDINNLQIRQLDYPEIYLSSVQPGSLQPTSTSVSVTKIDPAHYRLNVSKTSPAKELLVFSELYDSRWQAKYDSGKLIPATDHFLTNIYANGWLTDRVGNYMIDIIYQPQQLFDIAELVSATSIAILALFIFITYAKNNFHNS